MTITLRLFAGLRKLLPPGAPRGWCSLELAEGQTIRNVIESMEIDAAQAQMVLVNGLQERELDRALADGDTLSIFPPLAGGATTDGAPPSQPT